MRAFVEKKFTIRILLIINCEKNAVNFKAFLLFNIILKEIL